MATVDYGPIPISRLKEEGAASFAALSKGQRVLISRHGHVVAVIEPASLTRHGAQLARFAAVSTSEEIRDLSATDLGQGSPSEYIRLAEDGIPSLVTKKGKVYGVLSAPNGVEELATVDDRERALKKFEHDNPGATPAEIANFSVEWDDTTDTRADVADVDVPTLVAHTGAREARYAGANYWAGAVLLSDAEFDTRLLTEALLVRGIALERAQAGDEAVRTFETVIRRFKHETDAVVRRQVNSSMMELAKIYAEHDRPVDAVSLTEEIEIRIGAGGPMGPLTRSQVALGDGN